MRRRWSFIFPLLQVILIQNMTSNKKKINKFHALDCSKSIRNAFAEISPLLRELSYS